MNVKEKVAIVTGASGGIGKATAHLLAQKGVKVALVARSEEKLLTLSQDLPDSLVCVADMSEETAVRTMVQKVHNHYGKIDILVNNAGQGYDAFVEEIDSQEFRNLFNLNIIGPLIAMQEVVPYMKKQKSGCIVNISSGTALMYLPGMSAYSSLKRALVGISLTAREELAESGISVSVVYPYITATDFEKHTIKTPRVSQSAETEEEYPRDLPPADTPEYIAEKIFEAIITKKAEVFAHDWMGKRK